MSTSYEFDWKLTEAPDHMQNRADKNLPSREVQAYLCGPCRAIYSRDSGRHHISISRQDRIPKWNELSYVADRIVERRDLGDVFFCVPHPPEDYWMNYHPNTLHLWETTDEWLIEQMMLEGEELDHEKGGRGVIKSGH